MVNVWPLTQEFTAAAKVAANCAGGHLCQQQPQFPFLEIAERLHYRLDTKTAICVDFSDGKLQHRQKYGGRELITKAIGAVKSQRPSVLDCTAGTGKDAYIMASHGCHVTMLERNPVVQLLLANGLHLAQQATDPAAMRMTLYQLDAIEFLETTQQVFDVTYLDPMFPPKTKSAAVKKDMQAFHSLVGSDLDSSTLLELAINRSTKRVVVKRPDYAAPLADKKPDITYTDKKIRYDVYLIR